jgi:hypothetical protein
VGYHGYPRATADMDIWIAINPENARRVSDTIREFFDTDIAEAPPDLFLQENKIARMGVPPFRIEILTTISGVNFSDCYAARVIGDIDGIPVNIIGLQHLKVNKKASGRLQDLNDLEHLK